MYELHVAWAASVILMEFLGCLWDDDASLSLLCTVRLGAGAPVVGDCEGDYRHDSRKNILEWRLPVIDVSNKSGSMEFSIAGHTNDFFPVAVSFISKKSFCDIEVRTDLSSHKISCGFSIPLLVQPQASTPHRWCGFLKIVC